MKFIKLILVFFILQYSALTSSINYGFNRFNDNISFSFLGDILVESDYGNIQINQNYSGNATLFNNTSNLNDNQSFLMTYDYMFGPFSILYRQNLNYVGDNYSNFAESSLINSSQLIGTGLQIDNKNYVNLFYGMDNHLQLRQNSIGDVFAIESFFDFAIYDWNVGTSFDLKRVNRSLDREENINDFSFLVSNFAEENSFSISANYSSLFNNYLRPIEDRFNIENRLQEEYDLSLSFKYNLFQFLTNSFSLNYFNFGRENSFREFISNDSKTGVVERRVNGTFLISNQIVYLINQNRFSFKVDYFNDNFVNTTRNESLNNESELNQIEERNRQLDYNNFFTRITFNADFLLNNKLRIFGSSLLEINRMDTPSERENKDRDQQIFRILTGLDYTNNEYLTSHLVFEARARHLVYLKSEFSADNNWERNLRLNPYFRINYEKLRMTPSFEIYVSYRDFDFKNITTNIRSDAQRLLRFRDSISYSLSPKYEWRSSYFYLYKETGKLDFESFVQSIDEIKKEFFLNSLLFLTRDEFSIGFGARYYSIVNESNLQLNIGTNELEMYSISPETQLEWKISQMTTLRLEGWYEFRFNKNSFETIPNLYLETLLNF